ncbi:Gfo/Idh/MocA family oxidoreductase [Micromonospora yasonensis]|uniref:Gfo/Idh/MocA family protein n=1 Tax=Micromonospora yasonensis TaxID=1128667 RepID=UPI0022303121|nr:Gfo/Idh/MocA family oxidoreductase [Micromonospora yasonensis]MCW3839581.1 Gfo/Idh/MocA family oxidoreductase [Micromonospora yasonensis]
MTTTAAEPFITGELRVPMTRPLSLVIVGAGARGSAYAALAARRPDQARVTAVAEPRIRVRTTFADRYGIPDARQFDNWRDLAQLPRMADVAVVAVQDLDHKDAAVALADLGYQLLLEKPMATSEADCEAIADAVRRNRTALAIAHVMRYTPYTVALKQLLAHGAIGDIVSIQHLEPIGYYHFVHSFVRGSWRREDESAFLLLAKSCHDIDWLCDIVGQPVRRVSSFGSLTHFTSSNAPAGATDRCLTCPLTKTCVYAAPRMYLDGLRHGGAKQYYASVVTAGELTEDAVTAALADGPYGRCVYHSDNDVVDHQVVNLEFDGGTTAAFTLTAFTPLENRRTKIFGTRGQLTGDGRHLEVYDFRTERTTVIDTDLDGSSAADGHAGGDAGLVNAYIDALHGGRPDLIVSGIDASLMSHRVVFAAERARRTGEVVPL